MSVNESSRATERINSLAKPRTNSVATVAAVVLAGELIALALLWSADVGVLGEARINDLVVTLSVVAAAATAIAQVARSAGQAPEPGHRWLLGAWVVVAAMAANSVGNLPLEKTASPFGAPEIDRALLYVLAWLLALAVGVLGADLGPTSRRMPYVLQGGVGAVALVGGWAMPSGWLLGPLGVRDRYVILTGVVVAVALVAMIRWLFRWRQQGSWSLTWSGTGLVLGTLGVLLQLVADFGNDLIWVASTGLLVSSLLVPGMGAVVASGAMASAQTLARRRLRDELTAPIPVSVRTPDQAVHLPMLDSLEVELAPVALVETRTVTGSLVHAVLPGDDIGSDWWRAQAQALGLGARLEAAYAARALEAIRDRGNDEWVVLPVRADAVGEDLLAVLESASPPGLVVALRGTPRSAVRAMERLRALGITCGIRTAGYEPRVLGQVDSAALAFVMVAGELAAGMHQDAERRRVVTAIVEQAHASSLPVLVEGIADPQDLWHLEDLGVRWVAGRAVDRMLERATATPDAATVGLIEAAGLREPQGPART